MKVMLKWQMNLFKMTKLNKQKVNLLLIRLRNKMKKLKMLIWNLIIRKIKKWILILKTKINLKLKLKLILNNRLSFKKTKLRMKISKKMMSLKIMMMFLMMSWSKKIWLRCMNNFWIQSNLNNLIWLIKKIKMMMNLILKIIMQVSCYKIWKNLIILSKEVIFKKCLLNGELILFDIDNLWIY